MKGTERRREQVGGRRHGFRSESISFCDDKSKSTCFHFVSWCAGRRALFSRKAPFAFAAKLQRDEQRCTPRRSSSHHCPSSIHLHILSPTLATQMTDQSPPATDATEPEPDATVEADFASRDIANLAARPRFNAFGLRMPFFRGPHLATCLTMFQTLSPIRLPC